MQYVVIARDQQSRFAAVTVKLYFCRYDVIFGGKVAKKCYLRRVGRSRCRFRVAFSRNRPTDRFHPAEICVTDTGIFGIRNIRDNTVISSLKKYLKNHLYLSNKTMQERTNWSINAMHIKTPTQQTQIRSLSGGNQQKVIFGRWMLTEPEIFLLDEPTRGIDVGAKYEIYQLIMDMARAGKSVIMVSSEMPELLGVCDRILVMSGGRLAGEVQADATTQEEIMTLAAKYV